MVKYSSEILVLDYASVMMYYRYMTGLVTIPVAAICWVLVFGLHQALGFL